MPFIFLQFHKILALLLKLLNCITVIFGPMFNEHVRLLHNISFQDCFLKPCTFTSYNHSNFLSFFFSDTVDFYISAFGMIFEVYDTASKVSVSAVILVRIQSECRKIQTRKIPNKDTFHAVRVCFATQLPMLVL